MQNGNPNGDLKQQITDLGLQYRLMTQFTSFVAVEEMTITEGGQPKTVQVPNILGDIDDMTVPGVVSFTLNGQALKMEPVTEGDDKTFWFIFRDLTSGKETYPAARFLTMPAPTNGKIVLDFNMAENPPCAYNPFTTCPLPPEQNRLRVRVESAAKKVPFTTSAHVPSTKISASCHAGPMARRL